VLAGVLAGCPVRADWPGRVVAQTVRLPLPASSGGAVIAFGGWRETGESGRQVGETRAAAGVC